MSKQVETSKETIKDTQTSIETITDTHIVNRVRKLSVGTTNVDPVVTGVGIIVQGGPRAISGGRITQGIIHRGKSIISSNVITHVLKNSSEMTLNSDSFPFNPLKSLALLIAPLTEPFLTSDRDVRALSEIRDSRPERGRIGTPVMKNKFGVEMTPSVSKVMSANSINPTLHFSDLQPMKGILHLRKLKKIVWKLSALKSTRSQIRANG